MRITDSENGDDIRSVRNDIIANMNRVEEIYKALTDSEHPASIELIAEKYQYIVRRIQARTGNLNLDKSTI